jgi:hypothetical protein
LPKPEPSSTHEPGLDGVRAAPTSSVRHLGHGNYVLLESAGVDGTPVRAVARAATGHERIVARVEVDHDILMAIEQHPTMKVARCSARGEPSSAYVRCEATVLSPEGRKNSEYLLNLSFGFVQRFANRIKGADYVVLELTPIEPATEAARRLTISSPQPPQSASQGSPTPPPDDAA